MPTDPTDPAAALTVALDMTGELVVGVREEQWPEPTPCPKWTVSDLVGHMVAGNYHFAAVLCGQRPAEAEPDNLVSAYRDSAGAVLAAFRQPGVLGRTVTVPFGTVPGAVALHLRTTDIVVHGWDLARATGQRASFPEDLAAAELAFSQDALGALPPGHSAFAPPRPAPDHAPGIDRLAACLGREIA